MGDAEGGGGSGSWDSGETCRPDGMAAFGSRAMMGGGSLPPRKRLLAGLKQNGWLSSSPPQAVLSPSPSPAFAVQNTGEGEAGGIQGVADDRVAEEGCMGCHGQEGSVLRRVKRGGEFLRLCNSCALLYEKNMFCPHCLVIYDEGSLLEDVGSWLGCCRCKRSVHVECEVKHATGMQQPDAESYVCPDCVGQSRRQKEPLNGTSGSKSKAWSGRVGVNCSVEAGTCASSAAAECSSPSVKKPRMMRERVKHGDGDHGDMAKAERERVGLDGGGATCGTKTGGTSPMRKVSHSLPVSPHEAVAAAKSAASLAVKAATVAKANAASKAAAAVKAAKAAKAALEAAALAARAEAQARAELRRKGAVAEPKLVSAAAKLEIVVNPDPEKERISGKSEVKDEKEEEHPLRGRSSVDDEELARQLHRAINSSPRISRSLNPMRRKPSVKPGTSPNGVSSSGADAARAWKHSGSASTSEPPYLQPKQQQTRPRSATHKEAKRLDSRISRHEVKKTVEEISASEAQQPAAVEMSSPQLSSSPTEDTPRASRAESVEEIPMSSPRQEPLTCLAHDSTNIAFDAILEAVGQGLDGAALHSLSSSGDNAYRRPDYIQEILEAAVLTDTEMALDGGANATSSELGAERIEVGEQQPEYGGLTAFIAEEHKENARSSCEMMDGTNPTHLSQCEDFSAPVQDVQMTDGGALKDDGGVQVIDGDLPHKMSISIARLEAGSSKIEGMDSPTSMKAQSVLEGDIANGEDARPDPDTNENVSLVGVLVSGFVPEERNHVVEGRSDTFCNDNGVVNGLPQAGPGRAEVGSTWHQNKLKGRPGGGQTLANGVSLAPYTSVPQLPMRTPAVVSGQAGRHS